MRLRDAVTGAVLDVGEPGTSRRARLPGASGRPGTATSSGSLRAARRIGWRRVAARGDAETADFSHDLVAPMPGKVRAVLVAEGESVAKGATLLLLEAMKMEHPVRAPRKGVVRHLRVAEGAMVAAGERLLEME